MSITKTVINADPSFTPPDGYVLRWSSSSNSWVPGVPVGLTGPTGPTGVTGPTGPAGPAATFSGNVSQLTAGDGSAVNVGSGLTLAGDTLTGGGGGWQTTYEVDFTTLTPVASFSNGDSTIDGKTWTFSDLGATSTVSLNASDGLLFTKTSGSGSGAARTRTSLSNMGFVPGFHEGLIWSRVESTLSTSGGLSSINDMIVGNDTWRNAILPMLRHTWNSAPGNGQPGGTIFALQTWLNGSYYPNPSFYGAYTSNSLSDDVWVIHWIDTALAECLTGVWSGGWPSYSSLTQRGFITWPVVHAPGASISPVPKPTDWMLWFNTESDGVNNSNIVQKLKNLRVQVK